jgi:hypothetical protein
MQTGEFYEKAKTRIFIPEDPRRELEGTKWRRSDSQESNETKSIWILADDSSKRRFLPVAFGSSVDEQFGFLSFERLHNTNRHRRNPCPHILGITGTCLYPYPDPK